MTRIRPDRKLFPLPARACSSCPLPSLCVINFNLSDIFSIVLVLNYNSKLILFCVVRHELQARASGGTKNKTYCNTLSSYKKLPRLLQAKPAKIIRRRHSRPPNLSSFFAQPRANRGFLLS